MCCDPAPTYANPPMAVPDDITGRDDELHDIPPEFVQDALVKLAPRILAGVDSLTPDLPDSISANDPLPRTLPCTFSPPRSLSNDFALPPTHILSLTFETTGAEATSTAASRPEPEHLIVPAHQLVWSARCLHIAHLMSRAETTLIAPTKPATVTRLPDGDASPPSPPSPSAHDLELLHLPVITFPASLPAAALSTFPLLHTYLHTATLPPDLPPSIPPIPPACCSHTHHHDPVSRSQEYEALWRMCQAFGIAESDEIYAWLTPRWQAARKSASVWDA